MSAAAGLDVGVDLDGVCYPFVDVLREFAHRTTGRQPHTMPAPTCWAFYDADWGLTAAQFAELFTAAVDAGVMFADGDPMAGAIAGLQALKAAGHRVHLITDRASIGSPGRAQASTGAWLERVGAPFDTLTFAADKTVVRTDVFLEDHPGNYDRLEAAGCHPFLLDAPYNAFHPGRRVHTWEQFVDRVQQLAAAHA